MYHPRFLGYKISAIISDINFKSDVERISVKTSRLDKNPVVFIKSDLKVL